MGFQSWRTEALWKVLMQFGVLSLYCWDIGGAVALSPIPASQTQHKPVYSFGRSFLGLDKCNACIGTSICKKFFKEEIRFHNWLSPRLKLPPSYKKSYPGNYTDDSENWRPVVVSRLLTKYKHDVSDTNICTSAAKGVTCSIENVLRSTGRFQKWTSSNLLTPDLVQGLSSPMLRCPSQRLLDRIVRRYAEVLDAGSILMKHFTDRDKLRLLYTLAVNQHPIMLQIFPGTEGWPFVRYYGSCGRMMVSASTNPIRQFYGSSPETTADLAYQLLHVTQSLRTNGLNYHLYYTGVRDDMFGMFEDGRLFITDASTIGVIDKQEGLHQSDDRLQDYRDVFSCLSLNCKSSPPCQTVRESQSLLLICRDILPKLLQPSQNQNKHLQNEMDRLIRLCGNSMLSDSSIINAANALMALLQPLRPCSQHFAYRYPECKYNNAF
ncbi:divergent protein kinase domain 2B [Acipenser oxyrinchus oxyrinchus]|uniref:Divergent protein kinase domain 2B n=1 Tax=Acipenser oxyrinchus oxyrinchus TaxID=40147 RepID=A0AAD8G8L9_ACIOX|nr:divergent protein kinase domain 2B [Acipenser oxyrinchus oxyrinchus]